MNAILYTATVWLFTAVKLTTHTGSSVAIQDSIHIHTKKHTAVSSSGASPPHAHSHVHWHMKLLAIESVLKQV